MQVEDDHVVQQSTLHEHPASCDTNSLQADPGTVSSPGDDHQETSTQVPPTTSSNGSTHTPPGVVCLNGTMEQEVPGTLETGGNLAGVACSAGDVQTEQSECLRTLDGDISQNGVAVEGGNKEAASTGPGAPQSMVIDIVGNSNSGEMEHLSITQAVTNDPGVSTSGQESCQGALCNQIGDLHKNIQSKVSETVPIYNNSNHHSDNTSAIPNGITNDNNDVKHGAITIPETNCRKEQNQVSMISTTTQTCSSRSVHTQTYSCSLQCNSYSRGRGILVSQENVDSATNMNKQVPDCQHVAINVSQDNLNGITSIMHQDNRLNTGIMKSQDNLNGSAVNEKPHLSRCLNCGSLQQVHPWTRNVSFSLDTDTQCSDESLRATPDQQHPSGGLLPIADDIIMTSASVNDDREELVGSREELSTSPRDYLCLALFGTILSPLTGPCAIRYAVKSRRARLCGDYVRASHNGQKALVLTVIGVCMTMVVVGCTLYMWYYYIIPGGTM